MVWPSGDQAPPRSPEFRFPGVWMTRTALASALRMAEAGPLPPPKPPRSQRVMKSSVPSGDQLGAPSLTVSGGR